ncbi:MAG: hypothetical protein IJU23_07870 [Proteobacteria bacterium]|nr:hypothetical protein [Pseudomonadota bacterium]
MLRKTLIGSVLIASVCVLSPYAFADETADQQLNDAILRDQARQAAQTQTVQDANTQTAQAELQSEPSAPQPAQAEWQPIDTTNYAVETAGAKTSRIFTEIGASILGAGVTLGGSMMVAYAADHVAYEQNGRTNRKENSFYNALVAATIVAPFVEAGLVHWSGEAMHNWGVAWTPYAGGASGGAIGAALGAIGFVDSKKTGKITTFSCAAAGAIIGAITWYEISNNQERAKDAALISNLHPTFEFTDQYTAVGVGFDF